MWKFSVGARDPMRHVSDLWNERTWRLDNGIFRWDLTEARCYTCSCTKFVLGDYDFSFLFSFSKYISVFRTHCSFHMLLSHSFHLIHPGFISVWRKSTPKEKEAHCRIECLLLLIHWVAVQFTGYRWHCL